MIEEPFFKYFLMEPRAVEPCGLAQFNILSQSVIARRSKNSIRVISLVQHQALKKSLTIQLDRFPLNRDAAQPRIATDAINHISLLIQQLNLQIVEVGIARRPKAAALGGNGEGGMVAKI